jgi:hypothetical protein
LDRRGSGPHDRRSNHNPFDLIEADLIASAMQSYVVRVEEWFAIAAAFYSAGRAGGRL